jgi:hypothetical protein
MYADKVFFLIKTNIFFKYWNSAGQVIIQFIYLFIYLFLCCIAGPVESEKDRKNGGVFDKPRQEKSQRRGKVHIELHWI